MILNGNFKSSYVNWIIAAIFLVVVANFVFQAILPFGTAFDIQATTTPLLFVVVGGGLFIFGFKSYSKKKLIENIPTSRIRSVAGGLVEVKGKSAVFKEKIKSLLTNKNCIYHKTVVEKYVKSGKSSSWVPIFHREDKPVFYVKDSTGKILVKPDEAEFDLKPSFNFTTNVFNVLPKKIERVLDSENIHYKNIFGMHYTLRLAEFTVPVGSDVYVMGKAVPSEFKKGREEDALMIDVDKENGVFYISNRDEKDVTSHLTNMFLFGVGVGGFMICIGISFMWAFLSF
jgi:hypothetical protein